MKSVVVQLHKPVKQRTRFLMRCCPTTCLSAASKSECAELHPRGAAGADAGGAAFAAAPAGLPPNREGQWLKTVVSRFQNGSVPPGTSVFQGRMAGPPKDQLLNNYSTYIHHYTGIFSTTSFTRVRNTVHFAYSSSDISHMEVF